MKAVVPIVTLLLIVLHGELAHATNACSSDTMPKTWNESLFSVAGTAHGCVTTNGRRRGPVVVMDKSGREIISGAYQDGERHGVWTVRAFTEGPAGLVSEQMKFWFDDGVNLGIEGGRLSKLVSERDRVSDPTTLPAEEAEDQLPEIVLLAIERLISRWCEDCPSYAVEIHRGGRVEFIGYSGIAPLGPKCGRLGWKYAGTILRLATRTNLSAMMDIYREKVTHPGRLIVLGKGESFQKLISIEGDGNPVEVYDLARVVELALPHIDWDCTQE